MMHKTDKNKINLIEKFQEENSNEENFESLIDLFTLLSFVLIIATILFGFNTNSDTKEMNNNFQFKSISQYSQIAVDLPSNILIVILIKENNKDMIYLINSNEDICVLYYEGQKNNLWEKLENKKNEFNEADNIQLIIDNRMNTINLELFLKLEQWLAKNNLSVIINFCKV